MTISASLSTIVRRAIEKDLALAKGTRILVAVSGGPDSMALLSVLARLGPKHGLTVLAHGVDHGLRPKAAKELDLAESFARDAGVEFDRTRVTVAQGGNLQERARVARWKALADAARAHDAIVATAHHANDRAETLLMRLLRGTGARGLGVLPMRAAAPNANDVMVIRPLLKAERADVLRHLDRHRVPFAEDPSNDDPRYLRTRVRRDVLPLLAELDPQVVRHLETIADEMATVTPSPAPERSRGSVQPVSGGADNLDWTHGLPRPTQEALARLVSSRSTKARVWLPGGLVVRLREASSPKKESKK